MPRAPRRGSWGHRSSLIQRLAALHPEEKEPLLPLTMSTPPISPAGKAMKRSSVLGASRKIVSATVRRPFKAVGRVVGGRSGKSIKEEGEGEELNTEYGTLMEVSSEHSEESCTEIVEVLHPRMSSSTAEGLRSTRSLVSVEHHHPRVDPDWPVHSMERVMRQILLVCAAYILVSKRPEWLGHVSRATEYAVTAWGTCVVILVLAYIQRKYPHLVYSTTSSNTINNEPLLLLEERERERTPLLVQQQQQSKKRQQPQPQQATIREEQTNAVEDDIKNAALDDEVGEDSKMPHPGLGCFYIVDMHSGERIIPNSTPTHLSTEWFEMDMLVLIRTPDVDDPSLKPGNSLNNAVVNYLRGKQRHFEFQYQIKLKKVPDGKQVYFSTEMEEPIKMGLIQKAFVGAAMAFIRSTNPTFHYSITGSKERPPDGKYEKPHMSFTVEGSLDRLVVTKPGETLPQLGGAIHEDPESIKRRKKGQLVEWNTKDTYTMALWTSYVDFLEWKIINLPGIRPFGLASVLGTQSINMSMYLIEADRGNDKHHRADITTVINLELSNVNKARLGPTAEKWEKQNTKQSQKRRNRTISPEGDITIDESETKRNYHGDASVSPSQHELQMNKSEENFNTEDLEDADADAETAAELGEGIYLRSGDSVILREFVEMESGEDAANNATTTSYTVANGGGFAVLQEQDVCVFIKKVSRSKRNRLIKSGDTVMFKMIQKKGEETETRYLTIHRGWWLKWVSTPPSKNGCFTIYTHESEFGEGEKDEKEVRSGETQSAFLTMGGSFTLRHKRWSNYHVGVAAEPSPTYGGRMLGLYNAKSKNGAHDGDEQYHSDEGDGPETEGDLFGIDNKTKAGWMKPLVLCAHEPSSLLPPNMTMSPTGPKLNASHNSLDANILDSTSFVTPDKLVFSREHSQVDVPAWIEMMNRTERIRQLTYVVRVIHRRPAKEVEDGKSDDEMEESADMEPPKPKQPKSFVKLRTGRELAQIMAVGQNARASFTGAIVGGGRKVERRNTASMEFQHTSSANSGKPQSQHSRNNVKRNSFDASPTPPNKREPILSLSPAIRASKHTTRIPMDFALDPLAKEPDSEESSMESDDKESVDSFDAEEEDAESSAEERELELLEPESETESEPEQEERKRHGAVSKGKKIIGKLSKTAKSATFATGKLTAKTVVGTGKLTAKTVVGTGKLTAKTMLGTGKLTAKTVVGTVKLTGKVAVGAGKVAVGTGKASVRQSKKVAKGTVGVGKSFTKGTVNVGKSITMSAGKAVVSQIPGKSKKPPKTEPKAKRQEKDLVHVEVSKTMKKIERIEAKSARPPTFLAGELCAPEQSCRTASRVLSRMSSIPFMSSSWQKYNDILTAHVTVDTDQDRWFLEGNAVQLGVTPMSGERSRGVLLHESLVGRCLWESHWREEWCGMYETCVCFYAPLTKTPCQEISYVDITNVRPLDPGYRSPLPGYPVLVLETAWLCHYIAFRDEESRDTFGEKVDDAIDKHTKEVEEKASMEESGLRKARFWQGFQSLSESSLSSGTGKWAKISSNQKRKDRAILNGRRMAFDSEGVTLGDMSNGFTFVEDLLSKALSFSLESLEKDPDSFVEFLDLTSQLRLLPLDEIDFSSRLAFCLFANIYHCLLQQAMLLSVNGPLDKKSVGHFMRTSCYEVGGDVFSLAELYCCVLRGKMSKPINPKPPYIEAPKKSNAYRFYTMDYNDPRVNFVLNTGDLACPQTVLVLRASDVDMQLNTAAKIFLRQELEIDIKRRLVVLPKICEIYKNDFGQDSLACLKFCMGGLDEGTASTIRVMMMDESNLVIRYQHTSESYHSALKLKKNSSGIQINQVLRQMYLD